MDTWFACIRSLRVYLLGCLCHYTHWWSCHGERIGHGTPRIYPDFARLASDDDSLLIAVNAVLWVISRSDTLRYISDNKTNLSEFSVSVESNSGGRVALNCFSNSTSDSVVVTLALLLTVVIMFILSLRLTFPTITYCFDFDGHMYCALAYSLTRCVLI